MSSLRLARPALVTAFLLLPAAVTTAKPFDTEIRAFSAFARSRMQADQIPGLSIGFVDGDFRWAEGFGFADLENEVPAQAVSSFRLASVTKPMTAIAVLQLVESGQIDLDAPVQRYVPYFPEKPHPMTVRALLGHLGGISHYRNYDLEGHFKDRKDTRAALAVFQDFDLVAEPGSKYDYLCYGYNLLGAVIEGATGESYASVMRRVLWEPLGMHATRMDDPDAIIPHRVRGYRRGPAGTTINSEFVDVSSRFSAGGTRSTVVDLLRFARGVQTGQILSSATYALMWTSMAEARFLGGDVPGGIEAGNVSLALYPLSARAYVETGIAHLAGGDVAAARELLRRAHALDPAGLASASALNTFAYRLKSAGQLRLGLSLLDLARELHPEDANLQDSTGEFYLEAGERDKASAHYERALVLDPGLASAKRALERIRGQP